MSALLAKIVLLLNVHQLLMLFVGTPIHSRNNMFLIYFNISYGAYFSY
jgi:hypothetical protein